MDPFHPVIDDTEPPKKDKKQEPDGHTMLTSGQGSKMVNWPLPAMDRVVDSVGFTAGDTV